MMKKTPTKRQRVPINGKLDARALAAALRDAGIGDQLRAILRGAADIEQRLAYAVARLDEALRQRPPGAVYRYPSTRHRSTKAMTRAAGTSRTTKGAVKETR